MRRMFVTRLRQEDERRALLLMSDSTRGAIQSSGRLHRSVLTTSGDVSTCAPLSEDGRFPVVVFAQTNTRASNDGQLTPLLRLREHVGLVSMIHEIA
jgi:hypothetical protein